MAKGWSVPSPPTSGRECVLILDRSAGGFLAFAGALIAAGCAGAAVNSTAPFGHGSWLAAERERCDEECADRSVLYLGTRRRPGRERCHRARTRGRRPWRVAVKRACDGEHRRSVSTRRDLSRPVVSAGE